ncbi:MAG: pantothenate synthetase [Thermodesulfobacteriota bacterium]|nr:MAG: pantothenate synthetase [Thermodesulfobacteriota bacterium]
MTENSNIKIVNEVKEMQALSNSLKKEGSLISFVPTMGALHEGHLSLMSTAKEKGDFLVVSIFVNPTQFGPNEDFNKYTRDLDGDIKKISDIGVDVVFFPEVDEIYPEGFETYIEVQQLQKPLCGEFRPGHFQGVATVVLKLFNIVKPDIAIFGEKDYQQLLIIKKMVRDLHLEIEIIGMPIIREGDGLALSSRNAYLSDEQRLQALALSNSLNNIKRMFNDGENNIGNLVEAGTSILNESSIKDIDYLEIRDGNTLEDQEEAKKGDIVAIAAKVGNARLIDNTKL